jgi:hypothetical protein
MRTPVVLIALRGIPRTRLLLPLLVMMRESGFGNPLRLRLCRLLVVRRVTVTLGRRCVSALFVVWERVCCWIALFGVMLFLVRWMGVCVGGGNA